MRRYAPIKASRGTTWPLAVQVQIRHRDGVCVGPRIGMPGECFGSLEIDHVRASGRNGHEVPEHRGQRDAALLHAPQPQDGARPGVASAAHRMDRIERGRR